MSETHMELTLLPGTFALCRLAPDREIPTWALAERSFVSVTYTSQELSIVCPSDVVPADVQCDSGWMALRVKGPMDFSLIGVLASLTTPLAQAGIPIFAISTFDTDYLLIMEEKLEKAREALAAAGHTVSAT